MKSCFCKAKVSPTFGDVYTDRWVTEHICSLLISIRVTLIPVETLPWIDSSVNHSSHFCNRKSECTCPQECNSFHTFSSDVYTLFPLPELNTVCPFWFLCVIKWNHLPLPITLLSLLVCSNYLFYVCITDCLNLSIYNCYLFCPLYQSSETRLIFCFSKHLIGRLSLTFGCWCSLHWVTEHICTFVCLHIEVISWKLEAFKHAY